MTKIDHEKRNKLSRPSFALKHERWLENQARKKWRKFQNQQKQKAPPSGSYGKPRKGSMVVGTDGDPCPRCKRPTEIRQHVEIADRQRAAPFYYSRWFHCVNPQCKTTQIMPERFRVFRDDETRARFAQPEKPEPFSDAALDVLDEIRAGDQTRPPWE